MFVWNKVWLNILNILCYLVYYLHLNLTDPLTLMIKKLFDIIVLFCYGIIIVNFGNGLNSINDGSILFFKIVEELFCFVRGITHPFITMEIWLSFKLIFHSVSNVVKFKKLSSALLKWKAHWQQKSENRMKVRTSYGFNLIKLFRKVRTIF